MDPIKIIDKYYGKKSKARGVLIKHGELVAEKAVKIAKQSKNHNLDINFIKEAAMIHDIGIYLTYSPSIGCFGSFRYICHGYLGREIMEKEGFPKHGLVCERHIGMGLIPEEIKEKKLPLPIRSMMPLSAEEEVIALADKFFSKKPTNLNKEETIEEITEELEKHGWNHKEKFERLMEKFCG